MQKAPRSNLVARMQRELFLPTWERPQPDSATVLAQLLHQEKVLDPFQVWLVGSMLTRPQQAKDIDLLLTRRHNRRIPMVVLEHALITARQIGLHSLGVSVDACFRNTVDDTLAGELGPTLNTTTWKLEDHIMTLAIKLGFIQKFHRVGQFSIVFSRPIREANFYKKLPKSHSSKKLARALPRGILLEDLA